MGGRPKGLLCTPDGVTLVERWRRLLEAQGAEVVLVGAADAYGDLGLPVVADDPPGVGPIGGLAGLLRFALRAEGRPGSVLALACDLPYVTEALILRLIAAPVAAVVAPIRDGRWEPLCARYDARGVLPVIARLLSARRHALQAVLDEAGTWSLPLDAAEARQLRDWDAPEDLPPGVEARLLR